MLIEMDRAVADKKVNTIPRSLDKARVLIVDDEADIRFALTRILAFEGYEAEEAASGKAALTLLEQKKYDLMVLDMRMPGMNGSEVMDYAHKHFSDLLVIVLTGQATLESAIAATKIDSVVNYLTKPVTTDDFISAVNEALKKRTERQRQQKLVTAAAQVLSVMQSPTPGSEILSNPSSTVASQQLERFVYVHPITLDRRKRLITMMDENPVRVIELTKGETAVLTALMMSSGQTLSCHELVNLALGYDINETESESVIRPYIFRLRRKIEVDARRSGLIQTIRRHGYKFAAVGM